MGFSKKILLEEMERYRESDISLHQFESLSKEFSHGRIALKCRHNFILLDIDGSQFVSQFHQCFTT